MIEEVWKREQQAEHEKRKLEEMKKEIQEERKLAELQQDAVDAGHSKKSERSLSDAAVVAPGMQQSLSPGAAAYDELQNGLLAI